MKSPLDPTPSPADPRTRPVAAGLADGGDVYVRDANGTVHVLPDGPHLHPKVLGGAQPAMYAGDMTVRRGRVVDLTNLSGTFKFDDEDGLRDVADELRRAGLTVERGAVRFFPADGSRPVVLA
ncbi:hypothetical protein [Urbifossiella limnaea]|uniref:Uncharacterized protein n=1 Tax=Urbifossiella limnaea TaxID=2528023 RepID=A0A517XNB6_9BACT|nr:hypothetical protein [Urbifossiella limnaea]QDU19004.1 hypothetical protein ETAA1_09050 [Urbifossiella limnaea]